MENTNKQSASIRMLYLEKLLNEACELLIIFEDGNIANDDDKRRIDALFNEIKYNEELESEMSVSADDEAQDWSVFGDNKI
jgi:hypothetical protein